MTNPCAPTEFSTVAAEDLEQRGGNYPQLSSQTILGRAALPLSLGAAAGLAQFGPRETGSAWSPWSLLHGLGLASLLSQRG